MNFSKMKEATILQWKEIFERLKKIFCKNNLIFMILIVLCGLIIHLEMITREVSNPDTTLTGYSYIAGGWEVSLGRWENPIISHLRFGLSTPVYSLIASLLIMAICTVFLIDLFDIKNKINKILFATILITIPSFAVTLTYFYCSDAYQIAMLAAIIMPWCIFKLSNKKIGILLSSLCIVILMGIYQSYLGVACGLGIMVIILELINNPSDYKIKNLLKDILYFIIAIGIGIILYYIFSQIFLKIYNVNISEYSGANEISIMHILKNLPKSILEAYKTFYNMFFTDNLVNNAYYHRKYFYAIMFLSMSILIIIKGIKNKNYINLLLAIALTAVLPIALNIILLIATQRDMSVLMTSGMFMVLIFLIALLETTKMNILKIFIYIDTVIILYTYILTINATYVAIDFTKSQAIAVAESILNKIENTEGYTENTKICIIGTVNQQNYERKNIIYNMSIGMVSGFGYFWDDSYDMEISGWKKIFERYFGTYLNICSDEEYMQIVSSEEFKNMPIFPYYNSTKIIDNTIVIKLTNEPFLIKDNSL